jgi:hypothetical protein
VPRLRRAGDSFSAVARPSRFAEFRYLGDKRTQRVYDLDSDAPGLAEKIDELMKSEQFAAFCPDTLAEGRNRGYKPDSSAIPRPTDEDEDF